MVSHPSPCAPPHTNTHKKLENIDPCGAKFLGLFRKEKASYIRNIGLSYIYLGSIGEENTPIYQNK